jgi:riboflavin kinase/FMN adenylyltransferase
MIQGFASERMQVFRRLPPAAQRRPCALTIGNFDGVHLGHRALLDELGRSADALGLPTCVLTFEPHPREFFAARVPGLVAPPRIATLRDKLQALDDAGVDRACVVHSTSASRRSSPRRSSSRCWSTGCRRATC